jgi:polysaccharide deacetylase 2 family uncharacterized protein YibQ
MRNKLLIILVLAIAVLGVFKLRSRDIREDVFKTEGIILSVLQSNGAGGGDIVSREESDWKKGGIRGKTIDYVVRLDKAVSVSKLTSEIKEELKGVRGARLSRSGYRADDEKKEKTAYFEIKYKGNVILMLAVQNVVPDWVKRGRIETKERPVVALVLDDFGYTKKNLETLKDMATPITIAVLPGAPYSKAVSSYAARNGIEVILHLPLEPESKDVRLEKDTITTGMDRETVEEIMARDLKDVNFVRGVSNHQGSRATRDEKLMTIVLEEVKKKGLFFFDSLTTKRSVCRKVAEKEGVPYLRRDIFIDEEPDEDHIRLQMEKVEKLARGRGYVAAIGHERPETLKVLSEDIPAMKERGVEFVALSVIVERYGEK